VGELLSYFFLNFQCDSCNMASDRAFLSLLQQYIGTVWGSILGWLSDSTASIFIIIYAFVTVIPVIHHMMLWVPIQPGNMATIVYMAHKLLGSNFFYSKANEVWCKWALSCFFSDGKRANSVGKADKDFDGQAKQTTAEGNSVYAVLFWKSRSNNFMSDHHSPNMILQPTYWQAILISK